MARYCRSIVNWRKQTDLSILRNHSGDTDLDHYVSFAELRRAEKKERVGAKVRPCIATLHHLDKVRRHRHLKGVFDRCDIVCVVSKPWKKHLIEVEGVSEDKIRVVYNGVVNKPEFLDERPTLKVMEPLPVKERYRLRQELGIPTDAFVVGHLGRDREWRKDTKTYYEALDILGETVHPVFFEESSYPRGTHGLSRIGYHRYRDVYNTMDAYVVSSVVEGGPLGFLESVNCGVPCVSTMVGMAYDFNLLDLLCELRNPEQIADKIKLIQEDRGGYVEKTFRLREGLSWLSWEWTAMEYYRIYEEILCSV